MRREQALRVGMLAAFAVFFLLMLIVTSILSAHYCANNLVRCSVLLDRMRTAYSVHREPPHVISTQAYLRRMNGNIPDGAIIFLGDSLTQSLAVAAVANKAVNLGIGQQSTRTLSKLIKDMPGLERAGTIVLTIGINDILHGHNSDLNERLQLIHSQLPTNVPIIWNTIMPVLMPYGREYYDDKIRAANTFIKQLCFKSLPPCRTIETAEFLVGADGVKADLYLPDGIHLSDKGYSIWINRLKREVDSTMANIK